MTFLHLSHPQLPIYCTGNRQECFSEITPGRLGAVTVFSWDNTNQMQGVEEPVLFCFIGKTGACSDGILFLEKVLDK